MTWEPMGVAPGFRSEPSAGWRFSRVGVAIFAGGDGARVRMVAVTFFEDGARAGSDSRWRFQLRVGGEVRRGTLAGRASESHYRIVFYSPRGLLARVK